MRLSLGPGLCYKDDQKCCVLNVAMSGENDSTLPLKDAFPNLPSLRETWQIPQAVFDSFLVWLNPDREKAGRKYEDVRRRLIKLFTCRGCSCPEDLADETINRVIFKAPEIIENYQGDPAAYFAGVARNVFHEFVRRRPNPPAAPPPPQAGQESRELECLDQCMDRLPPDNRNLILDYYREEKRPRIDQRSRLAENLRIELNALRIRAHRIRASLQKCVIECLKRDAGKNGEMISGVLS
jgi:DNA-directed RNA polymerase specialized sigma24 family protein